MYNSGDAAEQIVRMSLEGAEVALKITGAAAKNIAAALYTVLKDQKKTKGKARIETMLRQQRPMTIYTVKKEDCPEFARQAKSYGILYAPIPIKKGDDTIDILVFEDDAGRANRIVEKFKLVAENTASIKSEIEKSRESRGSEQAPPEQSAPQKSEEDIPSRSRTSAAAKTRKKIKGCLRITMSRSLTAAHGKRCRKSVQAQSAGSLKTAKKICLQVFYTALTAGISCITISIIQTVPLSILTAQTTGETVEPVMKRIMSVPTRWNRSSFWN